MDVIDTGRPFSSWDEHDASSTNDGEDDVAASDLRELLLSIQGECEALRLTSAFRSLDSSCEESNSRDEDMSLSCARPAEHGGRAPAYFDRPKYATLLDNIEGSCRSLQVTASPAAKSTSDCSEIGGDGSEEKKSRADSIDEDRIGSLVAVRCALRSTRARAASQKNNSQKRRWSSKLRPGYWGSGSEFSKEKMARYSYCDADLLRLIPPELRSKVSCPVEV